MILQQTSHFNKRLIGNAENLINTAAFNRINTSFFRLKNEKANSTWYLVLEPFVCEFVGTLVSLRLSVYNEFRIKPSAVQLVGIFKQGFFKNKAKIFVIISRCYESCEIIRVAMFGERLHGPLLRNKRFDEFSRFLETLFFFQFSCSIHNTYQCGYILHGWMPDSHLPRWPHGCMM